MLKVMEKKYPQFYAQKCVYIDLYKVTTKTRGPDGPEALT